MTDIAIVGGGIVGLTAALALQHRAASVTVLEAGDFSRREPGGLNARSIALAHSSRQIFRALGVWPRLEAAPIRHIHVSARGCWGVTRLDAADLQLQQLGCVIEHEALSAALLAAVEASERIRLEQGAEFETLADGERVEIGYRQDGRAARLQAGLAVIADGARSRARAALGIEHRVTDYGQAVVFGNVEVSEPRDATAFERFTPEGPLAMLPLGGRRYACVWTLDGDRAQRLAGLGDSDFLAELQACFGYRLGVIERAGDRFSVPLRRTRALALHSGRCLLAGNAANALHPVAGQGFNLALRDIACLYELLDGVAPGALDATAVADLGERYQRLRRREQRRVIAYGDGLVALFSNRLPLLGGLRAAGLGLLDLLPGLKAEAALAGMGMRFGGNRLLRGRR